MLLTIGFLLLGACSANLRNIDDKNRTDDQQSCFHITEKLTELRTTLKEDLREMLKLAPPLGRNYTAQNTEVQNFPKSCAELRKNGVISNGVYKIRPGKNVVYAYCDMETDGGGWTVVQKRYSGEIEFFNGWKDYKNGFGNLLGEFWLGLETLYELTNDQVNELFIELEDFDGMKKIAKYKDFVIGSEDEGYPIKILGSYFGDAGDSFSWHAGAKFTTKDYDQDALKDSNCAVVYTGAWWYKTCHLTNLNGKYLKGAVSVDYHAKGMCWLGFRGYDYSLKTSKMLVRPKYFKV